MLPLLGFAFLSGLATILAPCIWPLLPIILSSAAASTGRRRPLGITLGIILSFSIFTLSLSALVKIFHFDPNGLRFIAVIIIAVLGFIMLFPQLSKQVEFAVSRLSSLWGNRGQQTGSGFIPGFITGLSLGIVWAPCAGPILAAIAVLAATGQVTSQVVAITFAYAVGTGIPLFIFAYGGQKIIARSRSLSPYTGRIQQIFGVVMIISALAIYTNYDKLIEAKLLDRFPQLAQSLNGFEDTAAVRNALNNLKNNTSTLPATPTRPASISYLFNANYQAPELVGTNNWLNISQPLTMAQLRGKVVLVDFWTYTCINCIRTLPHVTTWYDKYKDQGFVVIGVHSPEFEFEKNTANVQNAIKQFGIHYPVVQDNNYSIWKSFANEYWPAEYLVDANGMVRRTHFGEGEYNEMEEAIQELLIESGKPATTTLANMPDQTPTVRTSPETYLGTDRAQFYYPGGSPDSGTGDFTLSANLPLDTFSLGGQWSVGNTQIISGKNSILNYHFTANKVYLVLRPGVNTKAIIKVYLDGSLVDQIHSGSDVQQGIITVDKDRLYNLIDLRGQTGEHTLKLEFDTPGTEAFAFTFG